VNKTPIKIEEKTSEKMERSLEGFPSILKKEKNEKGTT